MPATLRDLAKKVGKSITTVSRALNNHDDISLETRAMVRQAAQDLGYHPSITAQRLQKRRSDTIGFVLPAVGPYFSDPFFSMILAGIASQAARMGVDLLVSACEDRFDDLEIYVSHVQTRRVDGFIVVRIAEDDARVEYLSENHFPVVSFGRSKTFPDLPFVEVDTEFGMGLVAEYLIRLGHRNFAMILPPAYLSRSSDMLRGAKRKLAENEITMDESKLVFGDFTQRSGYQNAQALITSQKPPTAILCANDLMALGAMSAIVEAGLMVAKDISVTGFEDIPLAEHSQPPLTTLQQPTFLIGQRMCELLVKTIRGEASHTEVFYPSLIIRHSCGPIV